VLELLFVVVLGWGVVGAALAPAIAQYCGLAVMLGLLIREKALLPEHWKQPPSISSVMPLLKVRCRGASLQRPLRSMPRARVVAARKDK
jgi:Na+-driven multidrug efflux pump